MRLCAELVVSIGLLFAFKDELSFSAFLHVIWRFYKWIYGLDLSFVITCKVYLFVTFVGWFVSFESVLKCLFSVHGRDYANIALRPCRIIFFVRDFAH